MPTDISDSLLEQFEKDRQSKMKCKKHKGRSGNVVILDKMNVFDRGATRVN